MPIVLSTIFSDKIQVDGRRKITEHHTDHLGVLHTKYYLADSDYEPNLAESASLIEAQLIQQELEENLNEIENGE